MSERFDYDGLLEVNQALRDERDRLRSALETVKYELAALFPVPSNPTLGEAMTVCGNKNEADARCIYLAYVAARAALTPAAGGTRHG